jgi:hypothetical protein
VNRFYAQVDKREAFNRQWRIDVLRHAAGSREARDWIWAQCRDDTLYYLNGFLWTYDPRLRGDKALPFITYTGMQDPAVLRIESAIEYGRDLVIEKSRDVGASNMCLAVIEKRWHFLRDQSFMLISRDEDEVDKPGYPDCLMWKIDFFHKHLPSWLMPRGWVPREHRKRFVFENPANGSTINGEATVGAAGVGGRKTAILIDEFSRIEQADEIDLGTADSTDCRIFNFTAYGEGNAADRMRREAKRKIVLHWSMDPRKNQKLYRWNGDTQQFDYYRYDPDAGEMVKVGSHHLPLVLCDAHEYTRADDDDLNVGEGEPPIKFEPVRDGRLRSPVYDKQFRRRRNARWMAINWDIDYVGSENKFFDTELLLTLHTETCRQPAWEGEVVIDEGTGEFEGFKPKKGGPVKLWCPLDVEGRPPLSKLGYGGGADISRGQGATNSCFGIADAQTGQKVLEYVTPRKKPDEFARRVVALCRVFLSESGQDTLLAWERQGPGEEFRKTVMELGYSNVYYDAVGTGRNFSIPFAETKLPGWQPSAKNRAELFGEYEMSLRQRRFLNRSTPALVECGDFIETPSGCEYKFSQAKRHKKGITSDDSGATANHGDRVTMDALCNRTLILLGRPDARKEKEAEKSPEETVGTWAWRAGIHKARERSDSRLWS